MSGIFERVTGLAELYRLTGGGDEAIRIALLDGPVASGHPSFAGARLALLSPQARPARAAHGTHVASIVAGQPGGMVEGVAPRCTTLCVELYREDENGDLIGCAATALARAINRAAANDVSIISIGGGLQTPPGQRDRFLDQVLAGCAGRNILIVAPVGDDGGDHLQFAAAGPALLAVVAADDGGRLPQLADGGDTVAQCGLLAPGQRIAGATADGGVSFRNGAGFAAAVVSGVAALLLSLRRQRGLAPDPLGIRDLLLRTADPRTPGEDTDRTQTPAGRLNVERAVAAVLGQDEQHA